MTGLDYLIEYSTDLTVDMISGMNDYKTCGVLLVKLLECAEKNENQLKIRLNLDYSKQAFKNEVLAILNVYRSPKIH